MALAGELRNKIYAEALASGNISILLLSKKGYAEAKPLIFEIYVLKLGRDELYFGENSTDLPTRIDGISPMPSEEDLPLIQNVAINRPDMKDASTAVWWLSRPYPSTKVGKHT